MRPTTDRVRETLFNWLNPYLLNANCLDLFSGSGVLGFEALSRGAQQVYFVEKDTKTFKILAENIKKLNAISNTNLIQGEVSSALKLTVQLPFDIIFLDPPYHQGLISISLSWLLANHYLHQDSIIYFEAEKQLELDLGDKFEIFKYKKSASLQYGLLTLTNSS